MKVHRLSLSSACPWTTHFHILLRKWAGINSVNDLIHILSRRYYNREYFKIFDGNEALKFHQSGCSSHSVRGSLVEVPFFYSNNITARFYLRRLRSAIKADYLILGKSLHAGKPQNRSIACQNLINSTYFGFIAFKALIVCGANFSSKWQGQSVNSHFC